MADYIAAEVARARDEVLATSDPHLLDVCHRENIRLLVLPDSNDERRQPAPIEDRLELVVEWVQRQP